MAHPSGPAWLGIGAQRSGTTWFTDLLCQHPRVALGKNRRKEQHFLTIPLAHGWRAEYREEYLRLFYGGRMRRGEFTPAYLRSPWVPAVAAEVLRPGAPIVVLLRDPIERYISAMRLARSNKTMPEAPPTQALRRWSQRAGGGGVWAGMYASQLEGWASVCGRERIVVQQYEQMVKDPQATVNVVWGAMGLDPVGLSGIDRPSWTSRSSSGGWDMDAVPGFRDQLRHLYAPEVKRLVEWGIRPELWPNFA